MKAEDSPHLILNPEKPPFDKPDLRRALALSLDRKAFIDIETQGKGDIGAGDILRRANEQGEVARDLAYRLYTVCERKGWAQEALAYNSLVTSWSEISRLAHREAEGGMVQATLLG